MSLSRLADLEEDNERLRDQLAEMETERDAWRAQANELKAQLEAKEEFTTEIRQIESRDGYVWVRNVSVTAPEWEQRGEVCG